jgi:hypothetical protein
MSSISSSELRRWSARISHDEEPPPPYTSEETSSQGITGGAQNVVQAYNERPLPALPHLSTLQTHQHRSGKTKVVTHEARRPLLRLGPINLCTSRDPYNVIAYSLKIRSDKTLTLFRSASAPTYMGNSRRATSDPFPTPTASSIYDIFRSESRHRSAVVLCSKVKDNLFSDSSSKLKLRKTQSTGSNTLWELYYHSNEQFESILGVPAPGSQLVMWFDASSAWRERGGRIVAREKQRIDQDQRGVVQTAADWTNLPEIDISAGLDPRFVDLIVACWAAKAYFP